MEEIEIDDKSLIVIINNIKGNINRLNIILEKLNCNLDIDYLILTGEVFNSQTKEEDIYKINFIKPTIIFDSSNFGEKIRAKNEYNNYILKNFIFLGRSGIFTPKDSSINFAFLSGNEVKEFLDKNYNQQTLSNTNKYFNYRDIDNLINKYTEILPRIAKNKIDFFFINNFPQSLYNRYINLIKEESLNKKVILNEEQIKNSISYSINYLLYIMNPRYLITSVDDFFYKNINDIYFNGAGYRTFFYNLAYLEDKKNINENFYIALDYKSLKNMTDNEISFMEKGYEEELGEKFIYDNNLFKFFNNYLLDMNKSLNQNFDVYLNFCFNENKMRSIKEMVEESKPLYLSNISFNCKEEEIKNYLIKRYGPIKQFKYLTNKENNKFNGKVIVQFIDANSMKDLLTNINKEKFNDRIIKATLYTPRDQLNNNNINTINNNNYNSNNNINTNNNVINNANPNNNNINNNNENISISKNNSNSSKNNDDCWFCYDKKEDSEKRFILEQFDYFYLSFSKGPINKYHFLIIPKKHKSFYADLSNEEKIECEMIIKLLQDYLKSKGYNFIIFEKNLKYNFSRSIHLLINVVGFENKLISNVNDFTENFLITEKITNYFILYNELDLYLYQYDKKDEYIYINIPKVVEGVKIIRKILIFKTNEYKIDYPRKMICLFINKKDRINWRDTMNSGDEFLDEIKKDAKLFFDNFFSK